LAYANLVQTVLLLNKLPIVAYDQACEDLFQQLQPSHRRIGAQDLKIAAVALVNRLTGLTRNRRDFAQIPGLVFDDWSV
jgi:tRNA(fMet)-specific endonuclease VapC